MTEGHDGRNEGPPGCKDAAERNDAGEHHAEAAGLDRQDILAKAKELAELIATSAEVDIYRRAEKQISGNSRVQELISAIKKKQKEAVAFEQTFKNSEMVKQIDREIDSLQNELDAIPIVAEFQQTQSDLNDMLQLVIHAVRDTVSEQIQVEEGKAEVTRCD